MRTKPLATAHHLKDTAISSRLVHSAKSNGDRLQAALPAHQDVLPDNLTTSGNTVVASPDVTSGSRQEQPTIVQLEPLPLW